MRYTILKFWRRTDRQTFSKYDQIMFRTFSIMKIQQKSDVEKFSRIQYLLLIYIEENKKVIYCWYIARITYTGVYGISRTTASCMLWWWIVRAVKSEARSWLEKVYTAYEQSILNRNCNETINFRGEKSANKIASLFIR